MAGNSIGKNLILTTFGESHGIAIGGVLDGVPPNIELDINAINQNLERRKTGRNKFTSQRKEAEKVEFLSGLFAGKTTGTPISFVIYNTDARSQDYAKISDKFRPGHADFTYWHKYGIRDYRGGGRSSARETAIRVVAGAIAKQILQIHGISVRAGVQAIGEIEATKINWQTVENDFFFLDATQIPKLEQLIKSLQAEGDSIGALVYAEALGVPIGLGEPVFDKLDADLAKAFMSVNAVKGVEIGTGFASVKQKGSEHRDAITPTGFLSNNAGGILGGITTGQTIRAKIAFKPTSSIAKPIQSINTKGEVVEVMTKGRHDPCVGIRGVPVIEAMFALTLADHLMRNKAQML